MKKIFLLALTVLLLTACASTRTPDLPGAWMLVSYGDASNSNPALPGVDTSIEFKDGQMSGNVGCNSFGGEYSVSGNTITFGPVMSTLMFCEATSVQEQAVLGVLGQGKISMTLDGDLLTLTGADGAVVTLARK